MEGDIKVIQESDFVSIGIYKIKNQINGKVYIGQSIHIEQRWKQHKYQKDLGTTPLYQDMRNFGIENFLFEIVEICSEEELNEKEIYYIEKFDSMNPNKGYNMRKGGGSIQHNYRRDYEEIFLLWKSGLSCKDIETVLKCSDTTITRALRKYNITESITKSRSVKKDIYVALSIDGVPLKIFYGTKSITKFFNGDERGMSRFKQRAIMSHYRFFGYYWEYLTEENLPEMDLTDEEFLEFQILSPKSHSHSDEVRLKESLIHRTVDRPSRDELKQLIRTKPFLQIGKMYGVSDNAIRKWCDFENLPRKKK